MKGKNENDLKIPENCPPVDYFISGFKNSDLGVIGIICGLFAVISIYIFVALQQQILAVGLFIGVSAIIVMFFKRDRYGENFPDQIRIYREFRKSVKHYTYTYKSDYIPEEHWRNYGEERNS